MWEELYQRLKKLGVSIRSVWMSDVAHQGKSSVVNEEKLGNDREWSRDLLKWPLISDSRRSSVLV